jgi:hypothetical protein
MRYKIVEPGWEGFSDRLGYIEFKDGVSVDDISRAEAERLSGVVRLETFEDEPKSHSAAELQRELEAGNSTIALEIHPAAPKTSPISGGKTYTADELAAVADSDGIRGIRSIAAAFDLKGTSIAELIVQVLAAQEALVKPVAAPEAAPE